MRAVLSKGTGNETESIALSYNTGNQQYNNKTYTITQNIHNLQNAACQGDRRHCTWKASEYHKHWSRKPTSETK